MCNSYASLVGLVLSFSACFFFILLVIAPLVARLRLLVGDIGVSSPRECTSLLAEFGCCFPSDNVFIITYYRRRLSASPRASSELPWLGRGRRGALVTRRPPGRSALDARCRPAADKFRRSWEERGRDTPRGGWTTNKSMRLARNSIWRLSVTAAVAAARLAINRHLDLAKR